MARQLQTPTPRCLEIYRLVVVRAWNQRQVAAAFNISRPRVCQVVRRVRAWVNAAIGQWLFPGRDDLRFYTALQCAQIRVHESPDDPETILLAGPDWTYTRHASHGDAGVSPATPTQRVSEGEPPLNPSPNINPNTALTLTSNPVNALQPIPFPPSDATPSYKNDFDAQLTEDLAHHLAHLLIDWRNSRSLTSVVKTSNF